MPLPPSGRRVRGAGAGCHVRRRGAGAGCWRAASRLRGAIPACAAHPFCMQKSG